MSLTTPNPMLALASSSTFKESYQDFREICLNFRSTKFEYKGLQSVKESTVQTGGKLRSSKSRFTAFGKSLKDFFVKKPEIKDINQQKLIMTVIGGAFADFFLTTIVIFVFWQVAAIESAFKNDISWVILLITAVLNGVFVLASYFLQGLGTVTPKLICKIIEVLLQMFVFSFCTIRYHKVFISLWYMTSLYYLTSFGWVWVTKSINYWLLLLNIALTLIDYFFLFSELESWFYSLPVLGATLGYMVLSSYEIRLLIDTSGISSVISHDTTRLANSSTISLFKQFYLDSAKPKSPQKQK